MELRITIVVDNRSTADGFAVEHGFAAWVELGECRLLFDTGQSFATFSANATRLGLDLSSADAIALSHGHYDHTGGLSGVLRLARRARLHLHERALQPRFRKREDARPKSIGMPKTAAEAVLAGGKRAIFSSEPSDIAEGVFLTGDIPRRSRLESVTGFYWDMACEKADAIPDDQALFIPTAEGTVVLLGCAHAGVINTLDHVHLLTGGASIRAVIGGMHLLNADAARLEATAQALQRHGVQRLAPCHCTGDPACDFLANAFQKEFAGCGCGSVFRFSI